MFTLLGGAHFLYQYLLCDTGQQTLAYVDEMLDGGYWKQVVAVIAIVRTKIVTVHALLPSSL